MTTSDERPRRRFLKQSAALVTGMTAASCAPPSDAPRAAARELDRTTLEALARIVLPGNALGDDGIAGVVDGFTDWLAGFEPVAELDHPYLWTDEIPYGPPDPAPRWRAQLEALELEATKRHAEPYSELGVDQQRAILGRQLPQDSGSQLPHAEDASHVAIGILAYFYRTSEANDLGYRAAIEKQTCRGLDSAPDEPAPRGD